MSKTTCISVRLRGSDIDKIKSIARRLDVSDSEIFRFGIRLAMSRLLPLLDDKACGFRVLPVFVENDAELVRHFDMDATHLERVINSQCVDDNCRVDQTDLNLLTLHGLPSDYLRLRLQELIGESLEGQAVWKALRGYLYRKYGRGIDSVENTPLDEAHGSATPKLLRQS
ncbi:MAG: hypothetical protein HY941_10125 [Gammaproteobacteria bacterium]|nr:hypothetical protein [Gammaproteobacteria bacterium]